MKLRIVLTIIFATWHNFILMSQQNQVYMTILNEALKEGDTVHLLLSNPGNTSYYLPIDFKNQGFFAKSSYKSKYSELPIDYNYFPPHFIESFYPQYAIQDSIGVSVAKNYTVISDGKFHYSEGDFYFMQDTTNYFKDYKKLVLLKAQNSKIISIPFKTIEHMFYFIGNQVSKYVYAEYPFEKNKMYFVAYSYKNNHCVELDKRITKNILKELDAMGYKCYDGLIKSLNKVPYKFKK